MNKLLIFVVLILFVVMLVQFAKISQQKSELNRLKNELESSDSYINKLEMEVEELMSSNSEARNAEEVKIQGLLEEYIHEKATPETLDSPTTTNQSIPDLNPLHGRYRLSQKFNSEHKALDFAASEGTEVLASASGKIISVKFDKYFGNMIIIEHNSQYKTLYAHLSKVLVKEGTSVAKGNVIGLVGNSGNSTAAHLHFEIMKNGINIDPEKILIEI